MSTLKYPDSTDKQVSTDEKNIGIDNQFDSDGASTIDTITALVAEDHKHEIKLRTMSWQKAAALLCRTHPVQLYAPLAVPNNTIKVVNKSVLPSWLSPGL